VPEAESESSPFDELVVLGMIQSKVKFLEITMKRIFKDALRQCSLLVGPRDLYRISRFLMYAARGEVENTPFDPLLNGEGMMQTVSLRTAVSPAIILDVGANVGDWTASLLEVSDDIRIQTQVHAFEPCSGTFEQLSERLKNMPSVTLVNAACSRQAGTAMMHVYGRGAGTNTLAEPIDGRITLSEEVQLITVDSYCESNKIEKIDLLKIDAEGYDYEVIAGAGEILDRQAVRMLQFEYSQRWIGCRNYLRDVFTFLTPKGYIIGKLIGSSIQFYPYWQWELETWAEGNYIACLKSELQHFRRSEPDWLLYNQD
jgi:FkbM family methyltransferase